jgi:hypothetical protein
MVKEREKSQNEEISDIPEIWEGTVIRSYLSRSNNVIHAGRLQFIKKLARTRKRRFSEIESKLALSENRGSSIL